MLDIEIVTPPTESALDILSVQELARHIRISPRVAQSDMWADILESAIVDTVDRLDGFHGELNRTLMPRTLVRYISSFPRGRQAVIRLPFPPLIEVIGISYGEDSPPDMVDPSDYVVRTGTIVGEIEAKSFWPSVPSEARAVAITYRAGYLEYPAALRRLTKFLAAHMIENSEATVLEQNKTLIDRRVLFAKDDLVKLLRVPLGLDDWK